MNICPACGSTTCKANPERVDATPYRKAAKQASYFRRFGSTDEAIHVLTSYAAILIANFVQPRWLCATCGVRFDD